MVKTASQAQWEDLIGKISPVKLFTGTCTTAASTAEKTVTASGFKQSDLVAGTCIVITMSNVQSYNGTVKLNINSTGAKSLYGRGNQTNGKGAWKANETIFCLYMGTAWLMIGEKETLYDAYGTNTDGALTQNFASTKLQNLENLMGDVHSVLVSING